MSIYGIAWGMYRSSIISYIPYLVRPTQVATAFGIVYCGLNGALVIFPIILAQLKRLSSEDDYGLVIYFCMGLSLIAFGFMLLLARTVARQNEDDNVHQTHPMISVIQDQEN